MLRRASGKQAEEFVWTDDGPGLRQAAEAEVAWARGMAGQVRALRKLEFEVADRSVVRALVKHRCKASLSLLLNALSLRFRPRPRESSVRAGCKFGPVEQDGAGLRLVCLRRTR